MTPNVLSVLAHGQLAPDRILPILTAVVQSYGIHDNLIDLNVGGLIFGLRVHEGETTWQEDTNFILYDPLFRNIDYISAFVRDDVLVVNSSLTNNIRVFAHSASTPSLQLWQESWKDFVANHINSDHYRYWVFLSKMAKVITVLYRQRFDSPNGYFRLQFCGGQNFSLDLNPDFMALLVQPLVDRGDGSLPFRLNLRNA